MRAAHLCNGLGGSLWTGAILGWESIYAMDHDAWRCQWVSEQAAAGWWPSLRVECADLTTWEPPTLDGGLDILAAGFSCRDISAAGKGAGLAGESSGPTYAGCLRAIDAWRPRWVFFENSPRIKHRGRNQVHADLRERGYTFRDGVLSAAAVGAPHLRDRWFLLAHLADVDGLRQLEREGCEPDQRRRDRDCTSITSDVDSLGNGRRENPPPWDNPNRPTPGWEEGASGIEECFASPADAMRDGLQIAVQRSGVSSASGEAIQTAAGYCGAHHWNTPNPDVLRVVDGMAAQLDRGRRIEALGDAWVPLQAATAWKILTHPQ